MEAAARGLATDNACRGEAARAHSAGRHEGRASDCEVLTAPRPDSAYHRASPSSARWAAAGTARCSLRTRAGSPAGRSAAGTADSARGGAAAAAAGAARRPRAAA